MGWPADATHLGVGQGPGTCEHGRGGRLHRGAAGSQVQPDLPVTTLLRAGVGPVPDPRQPRLERQVDCTPMTLPENRIPPPQKRSRTHLTAITIHSTNVLKGVLRRVAALGRPAGTLWVLPRPGRPVTPTPTTPNRCPLPSQFVVGEQTRCPAGSGPTPDRRAGRRRRTPRPQKRSPLLQSGRGAGGEGSPKRREPRAQHPYPVPPRPSARTNKSRLTGQSSRSRAAPPHLVVPTPPRPCPFLVLVEEFVESA
jgi:hypothetical protein